METHAPLHRLSPDEALSLAGSQGIARFVATRSGLPDCYPVHYQRLSPEKLLVALGHARAFDRRVEDQVVGLELDGEREGVRWTVMIVGRANPAAPGLQPDTPAWDGSVGGPTLTLTTDFVDGRSWKVPPDVSTPKPSLMA